MADGSSGFRWIGARVKRVEDPPFVLGTATYVTDVSLPNTRHVAFVRSPHAHARILRVDVSEALRAPGVVAVLTGEQAAKRCRSLFGSRAFPMAPGERKLPRELPCLPRDRVRYVGEAVVAIAAETRYQAEDAAELVRVEYEPLPAVTGAEQALQPGAPLLFEDWGDNVAWRRQFTGGDPSAAAEADGVLRERFVGQRRAGVPLEPRCTVAHWDRARGSLTVWTGNQRPFGLRDLLAEVLELPPVSVRVITPHIGGGFGVKANAYPEDVATVLLSIETGLPMKWVEDRVEHLQAASHDHEQVHEVEVAYKKDGTILGIRDRILADAGSGLNTVYSGGSLNLLVGTRLLPNTYKLRYFEYEATSVVTNKAPNGAVRGFGQTVGRFALERMVDLVARELGMDPAEVRFKNMVDHFPYLSVTGVPYESGSFVQCLRQVLEAIGYDAFRAGEQARLWREGVYQGIGVASLVELGGPTGPVPMWANYGSATVRIDATGRLCVLTGEATHGQSHQTTFAQVVAEVFDVPPDRITVLNGDTLLAPYHAGTFGNRAAPLTVSAVWLAANQVRDKVFQIAARLLEARPEDLEAVEGQVGVKGHPGSRLPLSRIASVAYILTGELPPGMQPGLESTAYFPHSNPLTPSNFAEAVKVEVDVRTGQVQLLKAVVAHDAGRIVNPLVVEGLVHGQIAADVGYALEEQLVYDEQGQLLTATLMDYHLPTALSVPREVEVYTYESPGTFTPLGTKGMAEGSVGVASIANAIEDALRPFGVRITATPITPERLLAQLAGKTPSLA